MMLYTKPNRVTISIDQIVTVCAEYFDVTAQDVRSKSRVQDVIRARHTAMYFARIYTTKTLIAIAREIGDKDHTTVIHAIKAVKNSIQARDNYLYPFMEPLNNRIRQTILHNTAMPSTCCIPYAIQTIPLIQTLKIYSHV
jgi:chromosomal replication initiator protein